MRTAQNFIIVNLVSPRLNKNEALNDLDELRSLVETFGGSKIIRIIQRKDYPDKRTYIGSGKAYEIAHIIQSEKVDVVIVNAYVRPGQLYALEQIFREKNPSIQVWDRVELILRIFEKHAHTAEARLQIETARIKHMGPRIYGMGKVLSQQGGGIGTLGIGETNTELMKRHWRERLKKIQDELSKLEQNRKRQLERRKRVGYQTISIVGYTNAGKTSLFNKLSGKQKYAENALFATLDSSVGKLYMPHLKKEVFITDTIGFIQNLPPFLITAFKSTLMESIHADILLHVIDIAEPAMYEKIVVVEGILEELGLQMKKRIYAFNKIDALELLGDSKDVLRARQADRGEIIKRYAVYNPQFISVRKDIGIKELNREIEKLLITPPSYTTEL